MTALMFVGIAQALFLSLLIGNKSVKRSFDYLLIVWLLCNACNLLFYYFVFSERTADLLEWLIPLGLMPYAAAAVLYLYTKSLVSKRSLRWSDSLISFSPYLVVNALLYADFINDEITLSLSQGYFDFRGPSGFVSRYWALIMAAVHILFILASLILLFKHKSRIKEEFSYAEQINLSWLRNWLMYAVPAFVLSFCFVWVGVFGFIEMIEVFYGISGFITLNIFVIGYFGLKQTTIFTNVKVDDQQSLKAEPPNLMAKETLQGQAHRIAAYLEQSQAYLNPRLTLLELSAGTDIPRNQLSAVLNQYFQQNFFEYINDKRVDEFKKRALDPTYGHLTLLGIALDCGFNSKSSFNHIFKKNTGMTPGEYKRVHIN
ncbi:MAG: AraC family transcriptional regulator [Cyclobacteriaceae bacterium]